jgi:hypothetical protein
MKHRNYMSRLWLFDKELIPVALKTGIFVGSILFLINHGPTFLRGEMTRERWISATLSYFTPYVVSIYSQHSYRSKPQRTSE